MNFNAALSNSDFEDTKTFAGNFISLHFNTGDVSKCQAKGYVHQLVWQN